MKFVISSAQRAALMPHLMPHLRADANAGAGAFYPIVSLYYDNPTRDCYWEKAQGYKSRRKLRVRVYGSLDGVLPPSSFIEVKHKCEGRNVKRRINLPLETALRMGAGDPVDLPLGAVDRRTAEEVKSLVHNRGFKPVCCMRYDRQAFAGLDAESDLRITFDTGIAFRMDNLIPVPDDRNFSNYLISPEQLVMEVKVTGSVPYWLSRAIAEQGCILQSHSKYSNALEAGDAVLQRTLCGGPKRFDFVQPVPSQTSATRHYVHPQESPTALPAFA